MSLLSPASPPPRKRARFATFIQNGEKSSEPSDNKSDDLVAQCTTVNAGEFKDKLMQHDNMEWIEFSCFRCKKEHTTPVFSKIDRNRLRDCSTDLDADQSICQEINNLITTSSTQSSKLQHFDIDDMIEEMNTQFENISFNLKEYFAKLKLTNNLGVDPLAEIELNLAKYEEYQRDVVIATKMEYLQEKTNIKNINFKVLKCIVNKIEFYRTIVSNYIKTNYTDPILAQNNEKNQNNTHTNENNSSSNTSDNRHDDKNNKNPSKSNKHSKSEIGDTQSQNISTFGTPSRDCRKKKCSSNMNDASRKNGSKNDFSQCLSCERKWYEKSLYDRAFLPRMVIDYVPRLSKNDKNNNNTKDESENKSDNKESWFCASCMDLVFQECGVWIASRNVKQDWPLYPYLEKIRFVLENMYETFRLDIDKELTNKYHKRTVLINFFDQLNEKWRCGFVRGIIHPKKISKSSKSSKPCGVPQLIVKIRLCYPDCNLRSLQPLEYVNLNLSQMEPFSYQLIRLRSFHSYLRNTERFDKNITDKANNIFENQWYPKEKYFSICQNNIVSLRKETLLKSKSGSGMRQSVRVNIKALRDDRKNIKRLSVERIIHTKKFYDYYINNVKFGKNDQIYEQSVNITKGVLQGTLPLDVLDDRFDSSPDDDNGETEIANTRSKSKSKSKSSSKVKSTKCKTKTKEKVKTKANCTSVNIMTKSKRAGKVVRQPFIFPATMSAVSDSYPFNGEVYFLPVILQFSKDLNILPHKLIPSVDCMCISDSSRPIHNLQPWCKYHVTKEQDFYSKIYDNKGLYKKQIVFINPPFEDKHIKTVCKLFRSRCMEGYLCLPAEGKWDYLELKDCFVDKLRKGGFVKSCYVFPCVEHKEKYTDLFCHPEGGGPKFDVRLYYINCKKNGDGIKPLPWPE